jgi:hypothetical protein
MPKLAVIIQIVQWTIVQLDELLNKEYSALVLYVALMSNLRRVK